MIQPRRTLILSFVLVVLSACTQPQAAPPASSPQFATRGNDFAKDLALDRTGDAVYVVGLTSAPIDGEGASSAFIARYSRTGYQFPVWLRAFGTTGEDGAVAVGVGPTGDAYVLWRTLTYVNDRYGYDYTLNRHDASGRIVWQTKVGAAADYKADVAVDPRGNAYVVGTERVGEGERAFVRKYDASGKQVWQLRPNVNTLENVAVSSSGNLYLVGWGPGSTRYQLSKVSGRGDVLWARELEGGYLADVTTHGSDTVYVAVVTEREDQSAPIVSSDVAVSSFSSLGRKRWTRRVSLGYNTVLGGLGTSPSGTLFVAGTVVSPQPSGEEAPGGDLIDEAFVRKYSRTGTALFTERFALRPEVTRANAVAAWSGGELYVVGETLDLEQNPGITAYLRRLDGRGREVWTD